LSGQKMCFQYEQKQTKNDKNTFFHQAGWIYRVNRVRNSIQEKQSELID